MSTALRYYGLIPEAVYTHQSMTIKHSRNFRTPVGNYDYKYISRFENAQTDDASFAKMYSKEENEILRRELLHLRESSPIEIDYSTIS